MQRNPFMTLLSHNQPINVLNTEAFLMDYPQGERREKGERGS
jgi:hypothetical protein